MVVAVRLDPRSCRALVATARVAVLAIGRAGPPLTVPVVFAVDGDRLVTAVDHKPKSTTRLARLDAIATDPAVSVLVDHYDDADWSRLWWVRMTGTASVLQPGAAGHGAATELLAARYRQYRECPPEGPAVVVDVTGWTGWSAAER